MIGQFSVFSFFPPEIYITVNTTKKYIIAHVIFTAAGKTILAGLAQRTFFQICPSWIEFSGSTSLHRIRGVVLPGALYPLPSCPSLALLAGGFNIYPIISNNGCTYVPGELPS